MVGKTNNIAVLTMSITLTTYLIYLAVMGLVTWFVGQTLYRNGDPFLDAVFADQTVLAHRVNDLLLTGFYLLNFALVLLLLQQAPELETVIEASQFLSQQIGGVLTLLGGLHFCNVIMLIGLKHTRWLVEQS